MGRSAVNCQRILRSLESGLIIIAVPVESVEENCFSKHYALHNVHVYMSQ